MNEWLTYRGLEVYAPNQIVKINVVDSGYLKPKPISKADKRRFWIKTVVYVLIFLLSLPVTAFIFLFIAGLVNDPFFGILMGASIATVWYVSLCMLLITIDELHWKIMMK